MKVALGAAWRRNRIPWLKAGALQTPTFTLPLAKPMPFLTKPNRIDRVTRWSEGY